MEIKKLITLLQQHLSVLLWFIPLIFISSCKKADNYYQGLRQTPELDFLRYYDQVYAVGDTLTIYGRLMADDLQVKVGDAQAVIVEKADVDGFGNATKYSKDKLQSIKVLITEAMGTGVNRVVEITSAGVTVNGPVIEIVKDNKTGLLPNPLTVEKIADYPRGFVPVYCNSGKGNMYFIDPAAVKLIRIATDGTKTDLQFDATIFKDNDGAAFNVSRFNGYGIDPDERYLYLSVYEEAPSRTYWNYYRLCRYDLQSGSFTVLNRTPYHIYRNMRTLEAAKPFEGKIADVKIFTATGIYPGRNGKVYFNMDRRIITRLDEQGNYTYIFKNIDVNFQSSTFADPAPQIYDEVSDTFKEYAYLRDFMPGESLETMIGVEALDPLTDQMYTRIYNIRIQQYDLLKQKIGFSFNNNPFASINVNPNRIPKLYSVGSFQALNHSNTLFGFLPMQNGKLLMLKYLDLADKNRFGDTYKKYNVPTWALMDFQKKIGELYAPGAFDTKEFVIEEGNDALLNYDAQGMLYMTAGNKSVIIKTIYK